MRIKTIIPALAGMIFSLSSLHAQTRTTDPREIHQLQIRRATAPIVMDGLLGDFYNGSLNRFNAGLVYRVQPWGNFALAVEQNYLRLPEPYGTADLTLINQRTEVNFSNKLFWTTFLQ